MLWCLNYIKRFLQLSRAAKKINTKEKFWLQIINSFKINETDFFWFVMLKRWALKYPEADMT
jgi:hypothetical protein